MDSGQQGEFDVQVLGVKAGVRVFLFCEATGEQVAVGTGAEAGSWSQREAPSSGWVWAGWEGLEVSAGGWGRSMVALPQCVSC